MVKASVCGVLSWQAEQMDARLWSETGEDSVVAGAEDGGAGPHVRRCVRPHGDG